MDGCVSLSFRSSTLVQTEIPQHPLDAIAMKFGTAIRVPPGLNCENFGDPLTFSSSAISFSEYVC